jgi:hypothetical protein
MDRKEYNKKYYADKKAEICKKLFVKVECQLCSRSVTHQNLPKHMKSSYCKLRQERNKPKLDILNELEQIKQELQDLKMNQHKYTEEKTFCLPCNEELLEVDKNQHNQSKLHKTNIKLAKL